MNTQTLDMLLFIAKLGLVLLVVLTLAAYLVFAERRILAWIQDRKGPNRVGPWGLLQPLAGRRGRTNGCSILPRRWRQCLPS